MKKIIVTALEGMIIIIWKKTKANRILMTIHNSRSNPFPPICLRKYFDAPVEEIFDAWINPDKIKRWMFKSQDSRIFRVDADVHSGGSFSILERESSGKIIDHFGKYFKVEKPHCLSFSLEVPKHFPGITAVYIIFQERREGCEMTFQQIGVDPALVEKNWMEMFEELSALIESEKQSRLNTAIF
jgi:uncharacterized protein YndB with AHSA1/START domain